MKLFGKGLSGGKSLVQGNQEHGVVGEPHGEEEKRPLFEPQRRPQKRAHEISDYGKMVRRIGHHGEPSPSAEHPLPVDLELQAEDRRHESVPRHDNAITRAVHRNRRGKPQEEEETSHPGREEEVDPDGMVELSENGLKIEESLEGISDGDGHHEENGGAPENKVDCRAYSEEFCGL